MSDDVGPLIATGRDGDIYEFGQGLVLRKTRDGRSVESEARVMRYAAEHGYPVPKVGEVRVGGTELIMERVDGPMMADVIARQPWKLRQYASMLADLQDQLHEIPAPDWLPRLPDGGDRLVHLDLHPLNVMLAARGPVVIDWTNAAAGEALTDAAMTYVLLTCPRMEAAPVVQPFIRLVRSYMAGVFARRYRGPAFDARLVVAAEMKALDRNMTPPEVAACHRLAARAERKARA
jgi:aminoglycoside phosphotransferase (APT) family kinase protein